jgi:hypothetical protein
MPVSVEISRFGHVKASRSAYRSGSKGGLANGPPAPAGDGIGSIGTDVDRGRGCFLRVFGMDGPARWTEMTPVRIRDEPPQFKPE